MTQVHSKALKRSVTVDRILGHYRGSKPGPVLVFFGGIHGNEPAGVFALHRVFEFLNSTAPEFAGEIIAITGNLSALQLGVRYQRVDLNREWTRSNLEKIDQSAPNDLLEDQQELMEINQILQKLTLSRKGPFYFFDLHTTSSETIPFLTVNDSLLIREFTYQYPAPIILGIEEYLDGPLLSYVNELGYVAFGFEGGQHDELASIANRQAFIYLSMVFTGAIDKANINYKKYHHTLAKHNRRLRSICEIIHRHLVTCRNDFEMLPGFTNFQPIHKGQHLANCPSGPINDPKDGKIFMPLYQGKGDDGYFIIRPVPKLFMTLSAWARHIRMDRFLPLLPGVEWANGNKDELVVDLKTARFLARPLLHLMGYRSKWMDETHLRAKNREAASRTEEYLSSPWMN
ncbi:hypothetical protein BST85_04020 [Aureitalea marina]|uniref:Succinylglutamate desuccinylase/Aspartoacylase catalytic domain-containing protein n=2 Tax=Aureitalea marina TaxID=930804 RepID=A0A2S7KNG8_9FLAO|nr:hypothetical protein BST85_04020 [Aureitalea marina]